MTAELPVLLHDYVALRRDLHAHPELAFAEHRTATRVADHLRALGYEVHEGIGGTGVVGVLTRGNGTRCIGLRADMDALPLTEANTFAHCSQTPGSMHACGHDGHTTMLLAAAELLAGPTAFEGRVVLIFQPAEEGKGGARAMIREGLLDRFPLDAVFGLHNWPGLAEGRMAFHRGPVMASADSFSIALTGLGAHAAMPHLGRDPLLAGAALVQALQGIVSRELNPLAAAVVSVTRFHAGEAYNAIAETATLAGTVRALSPEVRTSIRESLKRLAGGVAAAHGVEAQVSYHTGYPPTINDAAQADRAIAAAQSLLGEAQVDIDPPPSMGAEDFAFLLEKVPGCYGWIGNGPGQGGCTLHNPRYDFNDALIPLGAAYWQRLVARELPAGAG